MYRLGHEVWGEGSYNGRDKLILSNAVIPFPRVGEECDPQPRERMVMDKQRSTLNGHTTDEGGNGLYKGWNPGRIISYEESLRE